MNLNGLGYKILLLKLCGSIIGKFPKNNVINFVQLRDGNADEVIKNATWFELNQVELANK